MTSKSRGRGKRGVETSMERSGSFCSGLESIDLSHIRKPIDTSLFGLKQVVNLLETATEEVRQYLAYECDIIYECRVCRTIFRSLANFILHKRNYCLERFMCNLNQNRDETTTFEMHPHDEEDKLDIGKITPHLTPFVDQLTLNKQQERENNLQETAGTCTDNRVVLEAINSSTSGVFQTMTHLGNQQKSADLMKTEVMEIHNILDNNEAILGPDGKIVNLDSKKKKTLICNNCKHGFSTKKTLIYHIKYKHNDSRIIYPCPDCNETFPNAWSVFRHLYKIHRRTAAEVRKIRDVVHASALQRWQLKQDGKQVGQREEQSNNSEMQWLDNVEGDNDLQMCGGCGKRFERKAALHSHSQLCAKRIAVCGTIKDGRKVCDEKQGKLLKGSRRRKPLMAVKKLKTNVKVAGLGGDDKNEDVKKSISTSCKSPEKGGRAQSINQNTSNMQLVTDSSSSSRLLAEFDNVQNVGNIRQDNYLLQSTGIVKKLDEDIKNIVRDIQEVYENHVYENHPPVNESVDGVQTDRHAKPEKRKNKVNKKDGSVRDVRKKAVKTMTISKTETQVTPRKRPKKDPKKKSPTKPENNKKLIENCVKLNDNCNFEEIAPPEHEFYSLLEQTAKKHMKKGNLSCLSCEVFFTSYDLLMEHMASHFNWFLYQCSECDFMSFSKRICFGHMETTHGHSSNSVLNNLVVPVPNWKAISLSVDFTPQRCVEMIQGKSKKSESGSLCSKPCAQQEVDVMQTPIESDDVNHDLEPNMQNPHIRKMVMEVIFGSDPKLSETPNTHEETNSIEDNQRPIRNRVSTIQKDFLYDMTILKDNTEQETKDLNGMKKKGVRVYGKRKRLNADVLKSLLPAETASDNDSDFS